MERWISVGGLGVLLLLAWMMSSNRRAIRPRVVVGGLLLQFVLALLILRTPPGRAAFDGIERFFTTLLSFVNEGAQFVFGIHRDGVASDTLLSSFAFGVLPTVIFFSSFMSVLYYLGVMQRLVEVLAWGMQRTLGVSGAEALSAAANVFVGHTEAPLVIKPYVAGMTRSELNAVMVGGFATISGGLMAAYVGMGMKAGDLLTASVISAPAALLIAKILQPETGQPETMGSVRVAVERQGVNVIEAAAIGAGDGLKLALNVGAMLIAFLALIAMANFCVASVGQWLGYSDWSLESLLGALFAPIAWLMGIPWSDAQPAGRLLGLKMVGNEFIAYQQLGQWLHPESDIQLSERTVTILTYALCGFSNFGAIGIQLGGIGGLAPERRSDLAQLGLRAMLGGAIACCMTACVAGALI